MCSAPSLLTQSAAYLEDYFLAERVVRSEAGGHEQIPHNTSTKGGLAEPMRGAKTVRQPTLDAEPRPSLPYLRSMGVEPS